eukprot:932767-Prorocentrum_minimum.AAC.1
MHTAAISIAVLLAISGVYLSFAAEQLDVNGESWERPDEGSLNESMPEGNIERLWYGLAGFDGKWEVDPKPDELELQDTITNEPREDVFDVPVERETLKDGPNPVEKPRPAPRKTPLKPAQSTGMNPPKRTAPVGSFGKSTVPSQRQTDGASDTKPIGIGLDLGEEPKASVPEPESDPSKLRFQIQDCKAENVTIYTD